MGRSSADWDDAIPALLFAFYPGSTRRGRRSLEVAVTNTGRGEQRVDPRAIEYEVRIATSAAAVIHTARFRVE